MTVGKLEKYCRKIMERGRRRCRGRGHSRTYNLPQTVTPKASKAWAFISGLSSFFIMTSLIALIYLMLEFHCNNCKNKCDINNNFSKSIDDITKNLSIIKDSYYELDIKISRFSQDLPKLEGQINLLEALANNIEKSRLAGWDPKMQMSLPNVKMYLNKPQNFSKVNTSGVCSTCAMPSFKPVEVEQVRPDDSKNIKELRNQCVGYF